MSQMTTEVLDKNVFLILTEEGVKWHHING